MKKLLSAAAALGVFSAWSYFVFAGQDPLLTAKMEECFRRHSHLMDKPAVENVRACWRAHAYRMERDRRAG